MVSWGEWKTTKISNNRKHERNWVKFKRTDS